MIQITVTTTGPDVAASAARKLAAPAGLHQRMAGAAEKFLKAFGRETSKTEHNTATRLGARPTGHLEDAYNRIEYSSNEGAATLWIPRASRLRAAFGTYTVRPGPGKKFLTIPITAEAYGMRAREIDGLRFIFNLETKTALLVKTTGPKTYKPYYLLVKSAMIPEDPGLIPFDKLAAAAADAAKAYLLEEETPS